MPTAGFVTVMFSATASGRVPETVTTINTTAVSCRAQPAIASRAAATDVPSDATRRRDGPRISKTFDRRGRWGGRRAPSIGSKARRP